MTTENDKATAKILLSADEAVAEKIRRVLMDHPAILRETIKNMHMEDEHRNQQLRNQMYQQQAQGMRNAYQPGMAVQITERPEQSLQGFWTSIIGGKK